MSHNYFFENEKVDHAALLKILKEIREELAFIRSELHINAAGPCNKCHRKWWTPNTTGCSVCNKTLCPTCIKPRCSLCNYKCCDDHRHKCDLCDGYCTNCLIKCSICGYTCRKAHTSVCSYQFCTNCPIHVGLGLYTDSESKNVQLYCKEHSPLELMDLDGEL